MTRVTSDLSRRHALLARDLVHDLDAEEVAVRVRLTGREQEQPLPESHFDFHGTVVAEQGRPFQRLNRAEYGRAVKDMLDIDIDVASLLPADTIDPRFECRRQRENLVRLRTACSGRRHHLRHYHGRRHRRAGYQRLRPAVSHCPCADPAHAGTG